MKKKILIIGSGAKEYALAKKLSEEHEVYVSAPFGIFNDCANCADIRESGDILEFVLENGINLTVAASSTVLDSDIVTLFTNNGQPIFAPCKAAARLVFDKAYAKKIMYKLRIPTPKFGIFEKPNMVYDYIKNMKRPFVMKTANDGAAVFNSPQTAKRIADVSFLERNKCIIIEDYIYGMPFSFYTVTDGYKSLPIGSSVIYKHALDGGGGQITNGMGACSPNYRLTAAHEHFITDRVVYPLLNCLEREGNAYLGILGVNGIISNDGDIFILGFENFMQDCDAPAVLEILDEDLYELFNSCVIGSFSDDKHCIRFQNKQAVSVVLTCKNKENNGNFVCGLDKLDENTVITFYPSITQNKYFEYEASSGAVLSLTCTAAARSRAVETVYSEINEISFKGLSCRKDIGYAEK